MPTSRDKKNHVNEKENKYLAFAKCTASKDHFSRKKVLKDFYFLARKYP